MNVSQFSSLTGLSPHTIRYYDKMGLLDDVHRLPNGHRYFSEKDIRWMEFVQRLKATGMPLEQISEYARLRKMGSSTLAERQGLLTQHAQTLRQNIDTQISHLESLNQKIAFYDSLVRDQKPLTES